MEEQQEYEPSLRDYFAMARRRWRSAVLGFVAVLGVGAMVALLWPPVYRSTATILIEQQEIPQDLVRSTITSFAAQRIQLINQRVMTTANLLDIIRKHGLYAGDFDREAREVIIQRMRDDIHMDTISADVVDPRSGTPTEAMIAFTVGYDSRSPELASRVANELTSLYLQENAETRRVQAREAATFLADEASRLSAEIGALEVRLAQFKEANVDRLPELVPFNMQLLSRTEDELADVRRERSSLDQRHAYLEAQLAQMQPYRDVVTNGEVVLGPEERLRALESYLSSVRGIYTPDHPDVVRTEKNIASLREQLGIAADATVDLRSELAALRAERSVLADRYQPLHPDVVRVDRRIAAIEEQLRAAETDAAAPPAREERPDNPAYVQIQAQIAVGSLELATLDSREQELRARLQAAEQRLLATPGVERDFSGIARDLDSARLKFREVSAKQQEAVVAENLEMDAKAERFSLIEPPLPPERPVAPNRWLILFLAAVLALGAAIAAVALREVLDGSLRGASELEHLVGVSPLGVIPLILTPDDRRARRWQRVRLATATGVAFVALVVLAHLFVAPLDMIWLAALRRFGV